MDKKVKYIIVFLNVLVLILAISWYVEEKEPEPLIAVIGQFIALLVLFFEDKISKVANIKNVNTEIETDISGEHSIAVLNKKNEGSNIRTTIK
jgi:hypothetical protein